ncbi:MAG: glycoside hydrolase family 3 C-terminal domain-containing protein [Oscillospiraceae bacterium]|nr:glycoside hydrolase family 3 C-terminal domain-containing protein [Oscillospiraceae bacterium]
MSQSESPQLPATPAAELAQQLSRGLGQEPLAVPQLAQACRALAADGLVLLKNEQVLPLPPQEPVAVFGRCAWHYFTVGYGSGGDVRAPYKTNLIQGLREQGVPLDPLLTARYETWLAQPQNQPDEGSWGDWPMSLPEMPLAETEITAAASRCRTAVLVIGRAAGEDRDNVLEAGSYYLTQAERQLLEQVSRSFSRLAVIMDCGNLIDLSWLVTETWPVGALLYAWQGGMESGRALADVLTGRVNPSGCLPDTVPLNYSDLPSAADFGHPDYNNYVEDIYVGYRYFESLAPQKVLFPFGFGLSYSQFSLQSAARRQGRQVELDCLVRNAGPYPGRRVIQVYLRAPQGQLGRPSRELAAFAKTGLLAAGGQERLQLTFDLADCAAFDDSGKSGFPYAWVLEAGSYEVLAGWDVRQARTVLRFELDQTELVKQCEAAMVLQPDRRFDRLVRSGAAGEPACEPLPDASVDLAGRILQRLPQPLGPQPAPAGRRPDARSDFSAVQNGTQSLTAFVAGLSPRELEALSRGQGKMDSPDGPAGNAGALACLKPQNVPPLITTDGPAGIRLRHTTAQLPSGTALASSFDPEQIQQLYRLVGQELQQLGADILLAPGMNLHRNPLCGRNFEYFSEDPLLTGLSAAAVVRGLQSQGVSACPKHLAANNQETCRNRNDSRISQRALRELYLRGFERMVRDSRPLVMMTSYNLINGVYSHYNYDLAETILRRDWGYQGLLITDWWMQPAVSPEFPALRNDAYRIRAGVDVVMPGDDNDWSKEKLGHTLLDSLGQPEGITLGELQATARRVLKTVLALKPGKAHPGARPQA